MRDPPVLFMTRLLAYLIVFLAPVPREVVEPPELSDWGASVTFHQVSKYSLARHEGWADPPPDCPDWPKVTWRFSTRPLRVYTRFVWVDGVGEFIEVCDDPNCPKCSSAVYRSRR